MIRHLHWHALLVALSALAVAPASFAQMAREQTWAAYDTGSAGFDIAVAIARQFRKLGSTVHVVPAGTDVGTVAPVRDNRALISQTGIGAYFAQEGVFAFGTRAWGPQPVRLIMTASSCNGVGIAVAKDTGVEEVKDLRGKRIGVVVGSPAQTQGLLALIAFGGLTEKDVRIVEFPSFNAMWKGVIDNQADAVLSSTLGSQAKEAGASPRGVTWPPMVATDREGWARVRKHAPYFGPVVASCGAGDLGEYPTVMAGYPFPIFMTFADRPTEVIQAITKAMIDTFPDYSGSAPGADGMALHRQTFEWVVPYHDGAIAAFEEKDEWNGYAQMHNEALLARQKVLIAAWKAYSAGATGDDKTFTEGWMKARAAALRKAGMDPVFE
jgi:TRAP transporter TAXI family solute receptor